MILLIDNYDSFVHNLARYLRQLGHETQVVRNDRVSVADICTMQPAAIVLSPGPCAPKQAGVCLDLVRELHATFPILGICLGHQVIAEALGGVVVRAAEPVHGRASFVEHNGLGVFADLPSPIRVARYHSLVVDQLPNCLAVDAWLADGTPMAISHVKYSVYGWQFHPESVLTACGYELLTAFLQSAGLFAQPAGKIKLDNVKLGNFAQPDWFQSEIQYPK